MKLLITALLPFLCFACATTENPSTPDAYLNTIDAHSAGEVQYVGAYNNFKYRATIMNSKIQSAIIDRKAELYLWDEAKKQLELSTLQKDNMTTTKIFLSFFTPNRLDDNLASSKSIWAVYLETPQGRFAGTVKKVRTSPTELFTIFPYHNRFATAYDVQFAVPLANIESQTSKLIITGPLGVKSVEFLVK